MAKYERIKGGSNDLLVSTRQGRRTSARRVTNPRIRVRCGCGCGRTVDFSFEENPTEHHTTDIEINGVVASVAQWRQILRPLLGFKLASYTVGTKESGPVDSEWRNAR